MIADWYRDTHPGGRYFFFLIFLNIPIIRDGGGGNDIGIFDAHQTIMENFASTTKTGYLFHAL